jgi:hypothetical protein
MATAMNVQMVLDYLKANPEYARKLKDYVTKYPDETKAALKQIADVNGWDLSNIDPAAVRAAIAKL